MFIVCYIVREACWSLIKEKTTLSGKTTVAEEAWWREKTQYSEISNLNYFDEGLANTTFKVRINRLLINCFLYLNTIVTENMFEI